MARVPSFVLRPVGVFLPHLFVIEGGPPSLEELPDDPVRTLAREICLEQAIEPNEANVELFATKIGEGIEQASELLRATAMHEAASRDERKRTEPTFAGIVAELATTVAEIERDAIVAVRCAGLLKGAARDSDQDHAGVAMNLRKTLLQISDAADAARGILTKASSARSKELADRKRTEAEAAEEERQTGSLADAPAVEVFTKGELSDEEKIEAVDRKLGIQSASPFHGPGVYRTASGRKAVWEPTSRVYIQARESRVGLKVETAEGEQRLAYRMDGTLVGFPSDPLRIVGDWASETEDGECASETSSGCEGPNGPNSGSDDVRDEPTETMDATRVLHGPGDYVTESGLLARWPEGRLPQTHCDTPYVELLVHHEDMNRHWAFTFDGSPIGRAKELFTGLAIVGPWPEAAIDDPADHQADETEPSAEEPTDHAVAKEFQELDAAVAEVAASGAPVLPG